MGTSLPAVDLGPNRTATAISSGYFHTCAVLDNGTVKCWGENDEGQLGQGDTTARGDGPGEMGSNLPAVSLGPSRTVAAVCAGGWQTCVVLDDATVRCWGDGDDGALGLGDTANRGDGPEEMGTNLPPVQFGSGRTATSVSVGESHVCSRLDDGSVKCWGRNVAAQLGLGDQSSRGDGSGEMGDSLPRVALGTGRTAAAVTVGTTHSCAVLDDGARKCWGSNLKGELGQGDTQARGYQPNQMGDALLPIDLGGGLRCDGQRVTVDLNGVGTPTAGPDVILGTPGDDTVRGASDAGACGQAMRWEHLIPQKS
ncbi:MAG TPA: hypothetical protein VD926_12750 [Acidimicrobiales bacterium]|nr:hypothetical protein [Acidimicrobiales bacterium]